MACGFLYLVVIIDWASRAVLAWRLSNTNDASFCAAALEEGSGEVRPAGDLQYRQSEDNGQFPGGLTQIPIDRLVGWRREAPGAA